MPLLKPVLKTQLLAAFIKLSNSTDNLPQVQQELASDLATAIDSYIKSATIIVPPGQMVVTAGTPAAQTGTTTTPATAQIL